MADFSSWAQRRTGRGQPATEAPTQRVAPPAAQPQVVLPAAPPGYAWTFQAGQYVLIPLAPVAMVAPPQQTIVAPTRQPTGVVPFVHHPIASGIPQGSPAALPETCVLVKPADRDTYAELLAATPDLVPDQGYNADAGNPNPAVAAELGSLSEYHASMDVPQPDAPARSFTGGTPLARGSMPLKGAQA